MIPLNKFLAEVARILPIAFGSNSSSNFSLSEQGIVDDRILEVDQKPFC
jgi:hypothetical protein